LIGILKCKKTGKNARFTVHLLSLRKVATSKRWSALQRAGKSKEEGRFIPLESPNTIDRLSDFDLLGSMIAIWAFLESPNTIDRLSDA